jgi:hypothetical protein
MSITVCLNANTLAYPTGGGHRWVFLNWAMGLRANGCRIIWMEGALPAWGAARIQELAAILREQLQVYGFADSMALYSFIDEPLPAGAGEGYLDLDAAADQSDLLLEIAYGSRTAVVDRFRRSALVDIDPGILQLWLSSGQITVARHDSYFTIGETVGVPGSNLPDVGLEWHYVPPCVSLDAWKPTAAPPGAPLTTVSQWQGGDWIVYGDESYPNQKRDGFLPYLDLPSQTKQPLELALGFGHTETDETERRDLIAKGWRVRRSDDVSATPRDYQQYLQSSMGEFSCCKPSCVRLQNAWISDRTICYLASGRPAIVEHTGLSRFLPDAAGLFRFKSPAEALRAIEQVAGDYPKQSALARTLAEEFFDANKISRRLLEIALP